MPTTTTTPAELAALLRPALVRLTRMVRIQRVDTSVTLTQLAALATLQAQGPMSARELAAAERVQPPSMTKVLASLVEHGLVDRRPDPEDKRQVILEITGSGRTLLADERHSRNLWLGQRLATLEPAEQELLERVVPLLDKLAEQ